LRVDSPDLNVLNEKLGELPHTDTHPVYQPHITLCYLKRGMGEKYRNLVTGLEGTNLSFTKVVFSPTKGNKVSIDLEKSEYLEKAKPYTRTRLGKLERVKGYPGRGPGFSKPSFWDQRSWNRIADSSATQSRFYNKERLLLAYQSPADVHEGYTIGQHTEMVVRQFDKYFANKDIPILGTEGMRQLLTIHDIGKFDASRNGKPSSEQYIFNPRVVHDVFNQLKFSEKVVKVAEALVSQDLIGRYIKGSGLPIPVVVRRLSELADEAGVSLKDFYELAKIFYMSDASSYTEDAGGQKSLDYLFKFPSEYRVAQEYKLPLEFSDM
jgi:hypothetical protein